MNQNAITVSYKTIGQHKRLSVFDVADMAQNCGVKNFIHFIAILDGALFQAIDCCSVGLAWVR